MISQVSHVTFHRFEYFQLHDLMLSQVLKLQASKSVPILQVVAGSVFQLGILWMISYKKIPQTQRILLLSGSTYPDRTLLSKLVRSLVRRDTAKESTGMVRNGIYNVFVAVKDIMMICWLDLMEMP